MSIKALARKAVIGAGVYPTASRWWMWFEPKMIKTVRAVTGRNGALTRRYLSQSASPRLHIGCGGNHLDGWLNTELTPRGTEIYLDAARPFPFPDRSFDLIYTEHMIEHIPYDAARRMVRECWRVLRPGGTIRVVTPDMAFLQSLLDGREDPRHAAYFEFYKKHNRIDGPLTAVHLVNHFVRAWGHQFIYDRDSLTGLLRSAGFEDVQVVPFNRSRVEALDGIAKVDRMLAEFVEMESRSVEGNRPR
jgi:predicted SAM-dependent methyltransferase